MKRGALVGLLGLLLGCGGNNPPFPPDPCDACTPEQTCVDGVCVDPQPPPGPEFTSMLLRRTGPSIGDVRNLNGDPVKLVGAISCCMPDDWGGSSGWPVNISPEWQDYAAEKFGANLFHARVGPFFGSEVAEPLWSEVGGAYEGEGLKANLDRWNQAFFDRVAEWIRYAAERGRWVEIDLVDGWNCKHGLWGDRAMPWVAANNVQGEDIVSSCSAVEILPQTRFDHWLMKAVAEWGRFGNVIWQDGNEIGITGRYKPVWSLSMRDRVRHWEVEVGFNLVHLFGTNSNHAEVMSQVDYVEGHRQTPYPHPTYNRLSMVNEYNPSPPYTPDVMQQFLCTAEKAGTGWWYWRHGQSLQQMEETAARWRAGCDGVDTFTCPFETFPPTKVKVSPSNDATPLVCNRRIGGQSYCRYVGFKDGRSCCAVRTEGDPTRLACELKAMGGELKWWLSDQSEGSTLKIEPYHYGFKFRLSGSGTARVRCTFASAGGEDKCVDGPSGGAIWRTR